MLQEELSEEKLNPRDARESPLELSCQAPILTTSSWSRGGRVNSEVYDITSTLKKPILSVDGKPLVAFSKFLES